MASNPPQSQATQSLEELKRARPFIRCGGTLKTGERCDKVLGTQVAGHQVIILHGREIVASVLSMKCERCGAVWLPPEPALSGVECAARSAGGVDKS